MPPIVFYFYPHQFTCKILKKKDEIIKYTEGIVCEIKKIHPSKLENVSREEEIGIPLEGGEGKVFDNRIILRG